VIKNPKISIITVSYNSQSTIKHTIESVSSQTYKNKEYILIDGASKDWTLDILEFKKDEIDNFIKNRYPTISSGQLSDFKYPENYPSWDDKYEELLKFKGFARGLISTLKNHVNLDSENKEISDSNKKVYTIWGDSDSVVVYNDIKDKLNKLLPNRFEYTVPNSGHLPHIENQNDFEDYLFGVVLK
jgi:glycosyltransferase involved in cell wall biosynthesis